MEISATNMNGETVVFRDFASNGLNFLSVYTNSENKLIAEADSVDWSRKKIIATNVKN